MDKRNAFLQSVCKVKKLVHEDAPDAMKFAHDVGTVDAFSANILYRKVIIMSILQKVE